MYEVSCRDLGVTDCEFDLMPTHSNGWSSTSSPTRATATPALCAVDAGPDSPERRALRQRIAAAAHEVAPSTPARVSPPAHTHLAPRSQRGVQGPHAT